MNRRKREPLYERRLLSLEDFALYTSLGRSAARELAISSGAVKKVGRRLLVDLKIADLAIDRLGDDTTRSEADS